MMKRLIFLIILLSSILIVNNLVRSIYGLWQKQEFLVKAQKEFAKEKKENEELKEQLKVVESQDFIEKQARDKLLLLKPGESQVIISNTLQASQSSNEKSSSLKPNWRKWWELFFRD